MGPVAVCAEGFLKMARSARKEAEIRKAALRLFVEKGYEATSTREIARLAGTAEGNLYRHFASKTDLARKLFEACAERMGTALQNALAGRKGPRGRLSALLVGMFDFALQEPEAFAYLQQLHRHPVIWNPPPAVVLPKTYFVAVIREGIHQGAFRPLDPELATAWIVGMIQHAFWFWRMGYVASPEDMVDQTREAAFRILERTLPCAQEVVEATSASR